MRRYSVECVEEGAVKYFFISDCETKELVLIPSRYLTHKTKTNRSPNTVKRAAFAVCYYLEYLKEIPMEVTEVYQLDFKRQNEHFVNFLHWIKAGNHKADNSIRAINNGTCNAYLEDVFRFYLFIEAQNEQLKCCPTITTWRSMQSVSRRSCGTSPLRATSKQRNGRSDRQSMRKSSQSCKPAPTAATSCWSC